MAEDKGVPIQEIFTRKEIQRLRFFKWLFDKRPERREPQTHVPKARRTGINNSGRA